MLLNDSAIAASLKRVLVICSHEPELDPRIGWIADHAPADMARTVIGFADERRPRPAHERVSELHEVVRVERAQWPLFRAATGVVGQVLRHAPPGVRLVSALLLVFVVPLLLVVYELANLAYNLASAVVTRDPGRLTRRSLVAGAAAAAVGSAAGGAVAVNLHAAPPNPVMTHLRKAKLDRVPMFVARLIDLLQTNAGLLDAGRARKGSFQVVHANDLDSLPAAVLLKWETGCRVVYDAHEYWAYCDVDTSRPEEAFWTWFERALVRYVDAAFTVSRPLADALQADTGRPFAELPNAEPIGRDAIASVRPAQQPLRLLFLGNFSKERGLEELIRGWAEMPDGRAHLFLRGPHNVERQRLMQMAREEGVLDRTVHFEPAVLERDLVACAAEYDVGIIPYKPLSLGYRYCCPNKLSQYMQAGLAILTNDLVYVKQMLERFQCGVAYDSGRPDTLLQAVRRLRDHPHELMEMKGNALKAARSDFNWQRISAPLYEAYRRLA